MKEITQEIATQYFGECKFSKQNTSEPSIFYYILVEDHTTIYIEDWDGDDPFIVANIFHKETPSAIGFSSENMEEMLEKIKRLLNN